MADRIGKAEFSDKVLNSEKLVAVDFYSDSCIACKKLSPALGEAEEQLGDKVLFYKVNTNFDQELTAEYHVMAQPTIILFRNGEAQDRKTGALKPDELAAWLETYI